MSFTPLSGIDVLDLSRYLPGPFCTLQLAFLGANVTVIERPPEGEPMRHIPPVDGEGVGYAFSSLARGKSYLMRDLQDEGDRADVVERCLAADIVVESFRPGVAERLGVGVKQLREQKPSLIYCSISGFGQTGPWRDTAAHDANYLSAIGMLGSPTSPELPQVPFSDYMGGAAATTAICAALAARERAGDGASLDISITDAALQLQTMDLPGHGERWPLLRGNLACYNLYPCSDGVHICVGAVEPHYWANVCKVLGLPDEAVANQFVPGEQRALIDATRERFLSDTSAAWIERLEATESCCTLIYDTAEVHTHPQLSARGVIDSVAGSYAPGNPYKSY